MAPTDLAMTVFFLIFLAVFVLVGMIPFFQEITAAFRKYLASEGEEEGGGEIETVMENAGDQGRMRQDEAPPIYDLEAMIFRQLAQAGRNGRRLKSLASDLNLAPATVKKSAASLHAKGLVRQAAPFMLGRRYYLSGRGRAHAAKMGFLQGRLRR